MSEIVLVGDVGGTSSRFALARRTSTQGVHLEQFRKHSNDDFANFSESLAAYCADMDAAPEKALFALAGPVASDGSVELVNRDWPTIRPDQLRTAHGLSFIKLVNDFAAMSRAIPELDETAFTSILPGKAEPNAPILVTGPGTGFGVGTLIAVKGGYHVVTGEGGHASYAAHTVREAELAERLGEQHHYVSTEMVVGGAGLRQVFDVLSDMHGVQRRDLSPADIMLAADAGDAVCLEVCELRARSIMGAVGDAVLINGARGGAVLTGGVAERMVKWLKAPEARKRFYQRGSHSDYMAGIPVRVMTEAEAPLIGAAALLFDGESEN